MNEYVNDIAYASSGKLAFLSFLLCAVCVKGQLRTLPCVKLSLLKLPQTHLIQGIVSYCRRMS